MAGSRSFPALVAQARQALEEHLDACARGEGGVVDLRPPQDFAAELELARWVAEGGMDEDAFAAWVRRYLAGATHLHHPGYIGHQVAVTLPATAVADLINGVTNNGMAIHEMGPPAVALELAMLEWMCAKAGLPEGSGGVLTHGGSLANLTALAAARAAAAPEAWAGGTPRDLVLLAPADSHYCVARAAGLLGLGTNAIRTLPVDEVGRILPAEVERVGVAAEAAGERVMAVVANACITATGLHDDLAAIGATCRRRGWWFHVDAAHGASALLSAKERHHLAGCELADSLVWDAHKMLGVSALCAAVLLREESRLPAAFQQDASYLGDPGGGRGPDLFHRAVECTKVPLGLKLFLTLAIHGESGLAAQLEGLYEQTRRFAACLAEDPRTEVLCTPESNILCFRFGGEAVDQMALRRRLIDEGDFYITATRFGGRDWLRLTVMNPATDEVTFASLLDRLEALAALPS
jgi:L-2,4-diaminobutyrate decarboxylase